MSSNSSWRSSVVGGRGGVDVVLLVIGVAEPAVAIILVAVVISKQINLLIS